MTTWSEEVRSSTLSSPSFDEALRRRASLTVCDFSSSVDDARDLLTVLGLVAVE